MHGIFVPVKTTFRKARLSSDNFKWAVHLTTCAAQLFLTVALSKYKMLISYSQGRTHTSRSDHFDGNHIFYGKTSRSGPC